MKKIVAFVGSPRKNGNTATLVTEMIRGAESVGATTKIYYLNEMNTRPCQSCFSCRKEPFCPIEDDLKAVYPEIAEADAVIIGSPVYMLQMTAQTKILLDRLFPMMDSQFRPRFGIKKTAVIYAQGRPDAAAFQSSFDVNAEVMKVMGLQVEETLVCANANQKTSAAEDASMMARAFEMGKNLVKP